MSNSPLELHSADLANFGRSQTISLVSRPKFAKNYESQTENPSVVDSTQGVESSAQKIVILSEAKNPNLKNSPSLAEGARGWVKTPSLRGRIVDSHEAIQNKNQSARSANPCPTRHTEATKSPKYPLKSFCFVLLSQKVESPLPLNPNLPSKVDLQNLHSRLIA